VICIKTMQARTTKSSMWATTRTLVFFATKFCTAGQRGSPQTGCEIKMSPLKSAIGSYSIKTVTDKHRCAAYHNKH